MRNTLVTLFALASLCSSVVAQDILLGPYLVFKVGMNAASVPEGSKSSINFNGIPDFGLTGRWMFNKNSNMGVVLDVGYATYSFRLGPENADQATDASTIIIKPSYVILAPSLYLSGFTLGVAFGFPSSYGIRNAEGDDRSAQFLADVQDLNSPMVEARVGGMIPVIKSEEGVFSVLIQGGYMLTGLVNDSNWLKYDSAFKDKANNPKIVSIAIGVHYLFNLSEL